MLRTTHLIIAIILVMVALLGASLYITNQRVLLEAPPPPVKDTLPQNGSEEHSIIAKHQFKDGEHIIAGSVDLPTPCHILEAEVAVRESFPEQVAVQFNSLAGNEELCAQVITPRRFKVSFEASEQAVITATLNAEPVVLNLVQVERGEDLADFEASVGE